MANWNQLVAHTAEYMPGPYYVVPATMDSGPNACIVRDETGVVVATVLPTPQGRYPELRRGMQSHIWEDPVQEATARLMAEADVMLDLLSAWADLMNLPAEPNALTTPTGKELLAETTRLLGRHVRVGYEPARERPDPNGDGKPPYMSGSTILDMIDE